MFRFEAFNHVKSKGFIPGGPFCESSTVGRSNFFFSTSDVKPRDSPDKNIRVKFLILSIIRCKYPVDRLSGIKLIQPIRTMGHL
jgi:hypothetical protein